mgnify:CR=1 FL=1
MRSISRNLIQKRWFEPFILFTIILNCALIGAETYVESQVISVIQQAALVIFVIEITARWFAKESAKEFFSDAWNIFDLSIVLISLVPESLFTNATLVMSVRVLRVFRVLRLLRTTDEIKLIVAVLVRSFSALTYNGVFFFIFMYLFSLIGHSLFQLPEATSVDTQLAIEQLKAIAPNAPVNSPDPYGTLDETMFTLFRVLTGEDWTDLKYNLDTASKLGLISTPPWIIVLYHILWYILSAFLLLNLLVGAILNNYQIIMSETKAKKEAQ